MKSNMFEQKRKKKLLSVISMTAVVLAMILCRIPVRAASTDGVQDPQPELGAYFEIGTNGWISGINLSGDMQAFEVHSPIIVCSQLKAKAYGTAFNSAGSAVGHYDSGDVYYANAYQAYAGGNGTAIGGAPAYMHSCSRLIHVGYNTFMRGPYTIYP